MEAEKKYDRVEWSYLFKCLKTFIFHERVFCKIIVYPTAKMYVNTLLFSEEFKLEAGAGKGCKLFAEKVPGVISGVLG